MQAKVPQNVDIEDRVVGSLTLRQFVIVFSAIALITFLYLTIGKISSILWFLLTALIATFSLTLAFYKYGDQNLEMFLLSAYKTFQLPRKRVWLKTRVHQEAEPIIKKEEEKSDPRKKNVQDIRPNLNKLAEIVDSGGSSIMPKGRVVGGTESNEEPDARDIIEPALKSVDQIISKVKGTGRKEPLLSEIASVSPDKNFNYPKIKS